MRTLSAFLPVHLYTTRTIFTAEKKWKIIPACSSCKGGSLSTAISKIVTRLERHYDQEERQSDAAVHLDTIRPKLLRAFAEQEISQKQTGFDTFMKEVARRGPSIARIPKKKNP